MPDSCSSSRESDNGVHGPFKRRRDAGRHRQVEQTNHREAGPSNEHGRRRQEAGGPSNEHGRRRQEAGGPSNEHGRRQAQTNSPPIQLEPVLNVSLYVTS